jgi:hypothetical protein
MYSKCWLLYIYNKIGRMTVNEVAKDWKNRPESK